MLSSPCFDIAPNHDFIETAAAIWNLIAIALDDDTRDRTDACGFVDGRHLSIAKAAIGVDVQPHGDSASLETEDCLAIFHARGANTA